MFEKIKEVYKNLKKRIVLFSGLFCRGHTEFPNGFFKCKLIDTILELGLSSLFGAIIIGRIVIPQIIAVSTAGWDIYSALVYGLFPLVLISAWMMAIIYHVKYGAWPSIR